MKAFMDDLKTLPTPTLGMLTPAEKHKSKRQRHEKSSREDLDCPLVG